MEEEARSFLLKGGPQMREGLEGFLNIISGSITEFLIREHLTKPTTVQMRRLRPRESVTCLRPHSECSWIHTYISLFLYLDHHSPSFEHSSMALKKANGLHSLLQ